MTRVHSHMIYKFWTRRIASLLMTAAAFTLHSQEIISPQHATYEIAVLTKTDESMDQTAIEALYSAGYLCDVAGYSYFSTDDLASALGNASLLLLASGFDSYPLSSSDYEAIEEWVKGGGVLVSPAVERLRSADKSYISTLCGIDASAAIATSKLRYIINWDCANESMPELDYFDQPEEQATSIGNVPSYAYTLDADFPAETMARYEDGTPAVLRHSLGNGTVYLAGVAWREVILRNQLNKDRSASRCYNNGFEPSADVWALWLRSIVASHKEASVWKFTVPAGFTQLLIPTHDCDSRTAYDAMHFMSDYEASIGCKAHYFLTTHYFRDRDYHDTAYLSAFYDAASIAQSKELLAAGHTVGSHSICHFPDFEKCKNMDVVTREEYARRATCVDGVSTGASTWAEVVMSKQILEEDLSNHVRSFRSGHLCNNSDMPKALVMGDYEFASTFTGGDLLSEFPFFMRESNSWAGNPTGVLQIPLHISDVYNGNHTALNDDTWETHQCVDDWVSAMNRLHGNYASAVLLIHPNREWKMELEKRLVERLDPDETGFYNFEAYGDFWKTRLDLPCHLLYDKEENIMTIISDPEAVDANKVTFVIEAKQEPESVTVTDAEGNSTLACRLRQLQPGRYLAIPDFSTGIESIEAKSGNNKHNTTDQCLLRLVAGGLTADTTGRLTITGLDGLTVKSADITSSAEVVDLSGLRPGVYIARLDTAGSALIFHIR